MKNELTIPKGWKMTTLGEVADVQNGYAFRSDEFSKSGAPIIKIKNIASGKIKLDDLDYYEKDIENLKTFQIKKDDILVSMTGSHISQISSAVGKVAKYNLEIVSLLNQRVGKIYSKKKSSDNKYLWYLVVQPEVQFFWGNKAGGSANQANISPSVIKSYQFILPPLLEQRAIAAVLSSFDDKIELLREQNKTLEATAQTIFKEWFVNFNFPDKNGKPYKDSGRKMIDSELGEIPDEWRVGKLGDEFDVTIGRTPPRLEAEWFSDKPTGKKWISIKDIGNSETYISNTSEYLTDEAIEKFNIPVIPENTTILSFKMTVGKLAITTEEMLSNEAIAHLKIKDNSNFSTEFIFLFLKGLDFNSLGSTSSIVTAINSTMIKALEVLIPGGQTMRKFNAIIQPIFAKLKSNNLQIQTLFTLRDSLLPKLMRGEVRVKEFDK